MKLGGLRTALTLSSESELEEGTPDEIAARKQKRIESFGLRGRGCPPRTQTKLK